MKKCLKLFLLLINSFSYSEDLKDIKSDGMVFEFSGYLIRNFNKFGIGSTLGYQNNSNQYDVLNSYKAKNDCFSTVLVGFIVYKEYVNFFIEKFLIGINVGIHKFDDMQSYFGVRVSFIEVSISSIFDIFGISFVSGNFKIGIISESGNLIKEHSLFCSILIGLHGFYKVDGYNVVIGGNAKYGVNIKSLTDANIQIIKEEKDNSNHLTKDAKDLQLIQYKCNQIDKIQDAFYSLDSKQEDRVSFGLDISNENVIYGKMPSFTNSIFSKDFDEFLLSIKKYTNEFFILRNGGLIGNEEKLNKDRRNYFDKLVKETEKNKRTLTILYGLKSFIKCSPPSNDTIHATFHQLLLKVKILIEIDNPSLVIDNFCSFKLLNLQSNQEKMLNRIFNLNDDQDVTGIHIEFLLSLHNSLLEKLDLTRFKYFNFIDSVINSFINDMKITDFECKFNKI